MLKFCLKRLFKLFFYLNRDDNIVDHRNLQIFTMDDNSMKVKQECGDQRKEASYYICDGKILTSLVSYSYYVSLCHKF